jgi:hypothetical protein
MGEGILRQGTEGLAVTRFGRSAAATDDAVEK